MIRFRNAERKDHKALQRLYGEFVEQEDRYLDDTQDSFLALLDTPDACLHLALHVDELVGFVMFSLRSVFRYPRPIVEVEELFVSQGYRRQGVARELMKRVSGWAEERGAYGVFLASDSRRADAHRFYESLGYEPYGTHFRRML